MAAHAIGAEGVLQAVRAGVDSVEHAMQTTTAAAREMAERGTFRGPTLCAIAGIVDHQEAVPDYAVEKALSLVDDARRSHTRALRPACATCARRMPARRSTGTATAPRS